MDTISSIPIFIETVQEPQYAKSISDQHIQVLKHGYNWIACSVLHLLQTSRKARCCLTLFKDICIAGCSCSKAFAIQQTPAYCKNLAGSPGTTFTSRGSRYTVYCMRRKKHVFKKTPTKQKLLLTGCQSRINCSESAACPTWWYWAGYTIPLGNRREHTRVDRGKVSQNICGIPSAGEDGHHRQGETTITSSIRKEWKM